MVIAVVIAVLVFGAAFVVKRRRRYEAPTQRRWAVPDQLDRNDFVSPDMPWLVAVFTSATCASCAEAVDKAGPLAGPTVAVQEIALTENRDLHRRYNIEAVPTTVVADGDGVVRASYVGPPPAAELWAVVGQVRESSEGSG